MSCSVKPSWLMPDRNSVMRSPRDLLSYLTNHFSVLRYIASARAVGEHQAFALHFRKRTLHGVRVDTRLSRQLAHRRYLFTRRKPLTICSVSFFHKAC